jgi:hypothetical protein
LLKGRESLDDEVEGWTGREVEAAVEGVDLTSTAAPATDRFKFLALVLESTSRLKFHCAAGVEQLWS